MDMSSQMPTWAYLVSLENIVLSFAADHVLEVVIVIRIM